MKKNNYEILSEIELRMPLTKARDKELEKALREYESVTAIISARRYNKLAAEKDDKAIYNLQFPAFL
jgi:hypothetical protein